MLKTNFFSSQFLHFFSNLYTFMIIITIFSSNKKKETCGTFLCNTNLKFRVFIFDNEFHTHQFDILLNV